MMLVKSVGSSLRYARTKDWMMSVSPEGIDISKRDPEKGWVDATADEVPHDVLVELCHALTVGPNRDNK
jgi:hypothetical protein